MARIRLQALQRPREAGSLALTNPRYYFLAAQIQYMRGSNLPAEREVGSKLLLNDTSHDTVLEAVEADSFRSRCPTVQLMVKSWESVRTMLGYSVFSEFYPLCDNKNLKEFKVMGKNRGMGPEGYSLSCTIVQGR